MTSILRRPFFVLLSGATLAILPLACSGATSDDGRPTPGATGSVCKVADDCYPDVTDGDLEGEAICLEKVTDGYCTHACDVDTDCCAADGECPDGQAQVCSPFESAAGKMCLLSCEDGDVAGDPDAKDADEYCTRNGGAGFSCRSSGGGSENRKVCMPIDCSGVLGSACENTDDCSGGLSCDETLAAGYCSQRACEKNEDCPGNGLCAKNGSDSRCVRPCDDDGDCGACREGATGTSCNQAIELIDGSTAGACL